MSEDIGLSLLKWSFLEPVSCLARALPFLKKGIDNGIWDFLCSRAVFCDHLPYEAPWRRQGPLYNKKSKAHLVQVASPLTSILPIPYWLQEIRPEIKVERKHSDVVSCPEFASPALSYKMQIVSPPQQAVWLAHWLWLHVSASAFQLPS